MRGSAILDRAFAFALIAHGDQRRKGTEIPYISHLMTVASLVLEDGGSYWDGAAALLHDVVEDTPTKVEDVRTAFGDYIARIVEGCSDAVSEPKPPWRERKEAYLARLSSEPPEVLRVSVADKLHNARSILLDVQRDGVATLDRFNGGRDGTSGTTAPSWRPIGGSKRPAVTWMSLTGS
jgi:(p)ppGpp synthase/HD superfamily hydrolase